MKNLDYSIECTDCNGDKYITVPFEGNNSKTYPCGECEMMGEITVNPFDRFENEICEVNNAISNLVEKLEKDSLKKSDISQVLVRVVKEFQSNN